MAKIKEIVSDMQISVQTHNFKINKDMIDNEKLTMILELNQSEFEMRQRVELEKIEHKLLPKIKKRIKMKNLT